MAPPSKTHQRISGKLYQTIANYIDSKDGKCEIYAAPFAVFLNKDGINYVEPDISVICDISKLDEKGCHGAPDWIVETISPSNSSHDYILKLNLYANAGVREYWIADPYKERIFVYRLEQEHFEVETYTFHDRVPVGIYEDLQIDFASLDF